MFGVSRLGSRWIIGSRKWLARQSASVNFFHTTAINNIKEIQQTEANGEITIKGVTMQSPRADKLLNIGVNEGDTDCESCPVCRLGPGIEIRHTDVLILHQFVSSDGRLLPRKVTGLCKDQDRRMRYLVVMARHAGLLPKRLPDGSIDPTESLGWKANNKYYEESALDDMMVSNRKKL